MINFENGTLVKGAYVVIDGIEHEVHMPEYSGNTPLSPEIFNKMQTDLLKEVFPIGSTYITQENTNPNAILGFGTWERFKGLVALGVDEDDENLNEVGKTGGEKAHTLTVDEMPSHNHLGTPAIYRADVVTQATEINAQTGRQGYSGSTGGDQPHNNMQPFEVVGYMWIRRA